MPIRRSLPNSTVFRPRVSWPRLCSLVLLGVFACPRAGFAQDLVPGAYSPVPVGFNVLTVVGNLSQGKLLFDPALPVEDAHATISGTAFGLAHTVNLAGRYANVGLIVPVMHGHLSGLLGGDYQEVWRTGTADIAGRLAVNLYGAPSMTRQQFGAYRQKTLLGVSLVVTIPSGQYDPARFVNIGTNRWSIKPELGFSRRRGRWTFEVDAGGTFFTDNTNYLSGGTRAQAAIAAVQGHVIYTVRPGLWVAGDGNFWRGGRLTVNGTEGTEQQRNSRLGLTVALPIGRQQLRVAYSYGAYTRLGGDFKSLGVSYSYIWTRQK